MQCRQWIEELNKLAPEAYACEWDNPGFQAGRSEKEIRRVLVALDATDQVVEQAVSEQVDLLVTHHPLIFKPLKRVNDQNFISNRIVKLIQADICYFAMHTNFDAAPGCMADLAAERLRMNPEAPLEITGEAEGKPIGIGKLGTLSEPLGLEALTERVKQAFSLPFAAVYGSRQVTEPVSRIAVSPGAGGSMIEAALSAGAQVLVTGDIGHHTGIDAVARGMAVIDAGHYGLEHIFIPFVADYIRGDVVSLLEWLMPMFLILLEMTIFLAVMLPVSLKYGMEKSRTATMILGFAVLGAAIAARKLLPENFAGGLRWSAQLNPAAVTAVVFLVFLATLAVSFAGSVRIMQKKVF